MLNAGRTVVYLPIYFQACKLASPIRSGVDLFGLALTIAPFAIFTGLSVEIFKRYRLQNYAGWVLSIIGFSLLSTLSADSTQGRYIGYEVIVGIGLGITWISTQFPILAPLPYSNNAHALAFFTFLRCFAQVRSLHPIKFKLNQILLSTELGHCRRRCHLAKLSEHATTGWFGGRRWDKPRAHIRACPCNSGTL